MQTSAVIAGLAGLGRWKQALLMAGLGALTGLGQVPFGLPYLALLSLGAALAIGQNAPTVKAASWLGWTFGFGYFALTMHWIVEPFLVDIERYGWMAPFALVLLSGGLALFWGLAFGLAHHLSRGRGPLAGLLALVVFMTLAEWARTVLFTGLPWVLIGHIWIDNPMGQLAAYFGPIGLTLISLILSGGIAALGLKYLKPGWAALPVVFLLGAYFVLDPGPAAEVDPARPMVRLVQPNAPQDQKWDPAYFPGFQDRLLAATSALPAVDLVVWPETAIPWLLEQVPDYLQVMGEAGRGAEIVFGALRFEEGLYFNSLVSIGPDGVVVGLHDKAHLVPFGEYVPFGDFLAKLGIRGLAARDGGGFGAGTETKVINFNNGLGRGLPLICYEGIFSREVNAGTAQGADFLLLITNDAWFGAFAGPQQHFAQARLRSIEQGLPMIRVANTGISAMIDTKGRVLASIDLGQDGYVDARLPLPDPPTLYRRAGSWPVSALLLVLGLILISRPRRVSD